jgi:hypothetical protein
MKRLIGVLIVFVIGWLSFKYILAFIVGGHVEKYNYKVNDIKFNIKEIYTSNYKSANRFVKDKNNYLMEISINNNDKPTFVFKILGNYFGYQRIIKDIKFYQDNDIKCIYPVLKINYQMDVVCNKNNIIYNYNSIKGTNVNLDNFVKDLYNSGYKNELWVNKEDKSEVIRDVEVYKNNISNNHNIIMWSNSGVKVYGNNGSKEMNVLEGNRVFENNLGVLVNKYYLIPDYKQNQVFNRIFVMNILTGKEQDILLIEDISFNSVIQGIVNNNVYLYDKDNKKQYEINPKKLTTVEVGNEKIGYKYYDGKWQIKNINDINNNAIFNVIYTMPEIYKQYNYNKVDSVNGDTDGYYYIYVNYNNNIIVYRASKQKEEYVTYLFSIDKMNNIKYVDDYIYFTNNDMLYVYNDKIGLRPIIKNSLLNGNVNMYDVYNK